MYNTNIFKEIKEYLKPQQVAQHYISESGKKSGSNIFYKSPFRTEKTASFCVNDLKGFHDYGTGWHGDIINFVSELYGLKPIDAAKQIIRDFSLPIQTEGKHDYKEIKKYIQKNNLNKKVTKGLEIWFNNTFVKLCDKNKQNDKIIEIVNKNIKDKSDFENQDFLKALSDLYYKQNMYEMWIDEFMNVKTDFDKLELFRNRKEVEKLC